MRSRWAATGMPIMNASDGSAPRTAAHHHAAACEVVEQDHAVGEHQRVVVGERRHARAETDVLRAPGDGGDEHLGAGDDLVAGGVVLADPRLVEAEAVEVHDEVEVALEGQRRVLPTGWKGARKIPNFNGQSCVTLMERR